MKRAAPWFQVLLVCHAFVLLAGCGGSQPAGSACEVSGDGFTRSDECAHTCVDWEISCEHGGAVTPGVCSAGTCTEGQACPDGFECLPVGVVERECLPVSVCEPPSEP